MKVHLGCGERRLPGFVHVDVRGGPGIDHVADALCLPFSDGTVDLLYFCHGIEHIRKPNVRAALAEWQRVLKPGGTLRLATPDFKTLAELYVVDRVTLWRLGCLFGRQNYPENTHYAVYDFEYLAWHLQESGFYDIKRWYPERVHPAGYDDYSFARINEQLISLNVEATRRW